MNCSLCDQKALFKCTCKSIYLCKLHITEHLLSPGNHLTEKLDIVIEESMLSCFTSEAIRKIKVIENTKKELTLKTKALLNSIKSEHKQALAKLETILTLMTSFLGQSNFFKSDMKKFEETVLSSMTIKPICIDSISSEARRLYSLDLVLFKEVDPEKSKN